MKTIEELQGGWDLMGVQLLYIYNGVAPIEKQIPKVTFRLDKIAQEWLKLNTYGKLGCAIYQTSCCKDLLCLFLVASYIEKAVITPSVVTLSLEEYSQQLKDANPALY